MSKFFKVTVVGRCETIEGSRTQAERNAEERFDRDYVQVKGWKPSHWRDDELIALHPEHKAPVSVAKIEQIKG